LNDKLEPTMSVDPPTKKRPLGITILAYLGFIFGGLELLVAPLFLILFGVTTAHIERVLVDEASGAGAVVAGYGCWYLKRWTVPLYVVFNVIAVVGHLVENIPFSFDTIFHLLILFYILKNYKLFVH